MRIRWPKGTTWVGSKSTSTPFYIQEFNGALQDEAGTNLPGPYSGFSAQSLYITTTDFTDLTFNMPLLKSKTYVLVFPIVNPPSDELKTYGPWEIITYAKPEAGLIDDTTSAVYDFNSAFGYISIGRKKATNPM